MDNKNLISCLCVTKNRPDFLATAIDCFKKQTYPHKQLVIVYEEDDIATTRYLTTISDARIKLVAVTTSTDCTLGYLRNLSVEKADGEFICQWDDDDWYHENRLEFQLNAALNHYKDASILFYWLIFDRTSGDAYLSCRRTWEGSLLCRKSLLLDNNIQYPALSKMEDTPVIDALIELDALYPLICPQLYIYTYSGKNTWSEEHFNNILNWSQKLSPSQSAVVESAINANSITHAASDLLFSRDFCQSLRFVQQLPRHLRYLEKSV